MQVGSLVRHRLSESGMTGVVLRRGFKDRYLIAWADGRQAWAVRTLVELISEKV